VYLNKKRNYCTGPFARYDIISYTIITLLICPAAAVRTTAVTNEPPRGQITIMIIVTLIGVGRLSTKRRTIHIVRKLRETVWRTIPDSLRQYYCDFFESSPGLYRVSKLITVEVQRVWRKNRKRSFVSSGARSSRYAKTAWPDTYCFRPDVVLGNGILHYESIGSTRVFSSFAYGHATYFV